MEQRKQDDSVVQHNTALVGADLYHLGVVLLHSPDTNLQARKLLTRGSFTSVADLQAKVLAFIAYYNRTMAKPFKWTYQGKPLMA